MEGKSGPARTEFQREEHLHLVEQAIIQGQHTGMICTWAMPQFGVSRNTIHSDINEVKRRWAEQGLHVRKNSKHELVKAILRREHIFFEALKNKKYSAALAAEIDRCNLLRLYDPELVIESPTSTTEIRKNLIKKLEDLTILPYELKPKVQT